MKVPRTRNTHCPKCNKHTEHTLSLYRKGKDRALAEGNRRYDRKQKGYGGMRKPKLRKTAKTTKKQTFKLRCRDCGYTIMKHGVRLRRLEITA